MNARHKYRERPVGDGEVASPRVGAGAAVEFRPPCPHYPRCVGCPFIDVPYPEQLERKRGLLAEALAAYPALKDVSVPALIPSPRRLGYRARVKLVARRSRNDIALGLYVPESHRVVDISSCPVHPRAVNVALHYLKRKISELGIAAYDERDDSGDLRYVDCRYSFARREVSITLVSRHPSLPQGERLARALRRKFSFITGVIQNINETHGNVIWGDRYVTLAGRDSLLEEVGGFKLVFPAGVFSQANPSSAAKLYEQVAGYAGLTGKERVMDLYCGVGPISFYLAAKAGWIWGIDESGAAIAAAKQNARRNGVSNCRFVAGDVALATADVKKQSGGIDLIVLNPPRKGVQAPALAAVLGLNAPRLIYVSCEPTSLARDLDRLRASSYRILRLQGFDLFPQTDQAETVVLLLKDQPGVQ